METIKKQERKRKTYNYSAMERCEAVLAVWAERRKPNQVCKAMGIPWAMLNHWQDRALEAVLQALEPTHRSETQMPKLNGRLQKLLARHRLTEQRETVRQRVVRREDAAEKAKGQQGS